MRDLTDFVVWPDEPAATEDAQRRLDALQSPPVVFPGEMFSAGQLRQPEKLHAVMRRLGYITVQPRDGGRWRWYKDGEEFAARWAYISEKLAQAGAENPAAIGSFIDARANANLGRNLGRIEGKSDGLGRMTDGKRQG